MTRIAQITAPQMNKMHNIKDFGKKEAEDRVDAYDRGQLPSVSVEEAISKYKK